MVQVHVAVWFVMECPHCGDQKSNEREITGLSIMLYEKKPIEKALMCLRCEQQMCTLKFWCDLRGWTYLVNEDTRYTRTKFTIKKTWEDRIS